MLIFAGRICLRILVGGLLLQATLTADPFMDGSTVERSVKSGKVTFDVVKVAGGFEHPWAVAFLPEGGMLVTERPGRLWHLSGDSVRRIEGLPEVRAVGQGGLMDIILHPRYEENGWLYLTYSASYGDGVGTRLVRARLGEERLEDVRQLFEMDPPGSGGIHFGSRLAFDEDGFLFMTIGERNDRHRAQQLDSHHGSLLRLKDDGGVPGENPFVEREDAQPEIWSYGHRNAQGLAWDPERKQLWLHEHGPRGGDSLHIVKKGGNYGWPVATYGEEYRGGIIGTTPDERADVADPIVSWKPISIAPSGLAVYRGDLFPAWAGNLFVGALAGQLVERIELDGDAVVAQERLLERVLGRVRDVRAGPDGALWILTDAREGGLYKLVPAE